MIKQTIMLPNCLIVIYCVSVVIDLSPERWINVGHRPQPQCYVILKSSRKSTLDYSSDICSSPISLRSSDDEPSRTGVTFTFNPDRRPPT